MIAKTKRYFAFIAVGLPAFLLAIPLNYFLVTYWGWNEPSAYALVLVAQVSLNFVMCRLFVFEKGSTENIFVQFLKFMAGILGFRILDWVVYVAAVEYLGFHYLLVQVANVFLFSVGKFLFAKRIFEKIRLCKKLGSSVIEKIMC